MPARRGQLFACSFNMATCKLYTCGLVTHHGRGGWGSPSFTAREATEEGGTEPRNDGTERRNARNERVRERSLQLKRSKELTDTGLLLLLLRKQEGRRRRRRSAAGRLRILLLLLLTAHQGLVERKLL